MNMSGSPTPFAMWMVILLACGVAAARGAGPGDGGGHSVEAGMPHQHHHAKTRYTNDADEPPKIRRRSKKGTANEDKKRGAKTKRIGHVVVLMLENRSFDHMCGWLKSRNPEIDGLTGDEFNVANGKKYKVNGKCPYVNPFDPNHSFDHTTLQFMGEKGWPWVDPAPMSGFVQDAANSNFPTPETVMHGFTPERVPAISTLAEEFAIFDKYFVGLPGPTFPNRLMFHSGTSHGVVSGLGFDELLTGMPQKTTFDVLNENNITWRAYYQDISDVLYLRNLRSLENLEKILPFDDFLHDAADGTLPQYTWLSPQFYPFGSSPAKDQHPDHDVVDGEELIAEVYKALRGGPKWNETLFVVTYDEHGGFYDHVSPPAHNVPNPDGLNHHSKHLPFNFTRLGSRVCTVMASPWIAKGKVVHEPSDPLHTGTRYEHSSMFATLKKLHGFPQELTNRTAWAAPFNWLWEELDAPRTDCPASLPTPPRTPEAKHRRAQEQRLREPNGLQRDLFRMMEGVLGGGSGGDHAAEESFETQEDMGRHMAQWMRKVVGKKR